MDIKQAKEQIKKTCIAYLSKDAYGDYLMAGVSQRPIFLVGAPGIGKTAIVGQVADELGLAYVDYSMTHHTRQSAIGLPLIEHRDFDGHTFDVTEYTMSEIIARVYEVMEETGKREGILFLDEINCVSETLEPAMLRLLQNKMFGNCRIPDGWVLVCAGNPLEFNRTAKNFDIVTLDRVKRIQIEPDFAAWKAYATDAGTHPAVMSYLELKPSNFYRVEARGKARDFVTARAWSDLSDILRLYEKNDLNVDEELVGQYIQVPSVAKDFFAYIELFSTRAREYPIGDILDGRADEAAAERAGAAGFDERMTLASLISDALIERMGEVNTREDVLAELRASLAPALEAGASASGGTGADVGAGASGGSGAQAAGRVVQALEAEVAVRERRLEAEAGELARNPRCRTILHACIEELRSCVVLAANAPERSADVFTKLKERFNDELAEHEAQAAQVRSCADNALSFAADAFGEGNELVAMLSGLAMNADFSQFVATYGCDAYFEHSRSLMLDERKYELKERLSRLIG